MHHIVERGVMRVGTDGVSMGSSHAGAGVHYVGLSVQVALALAGLDQLPVRGAPFCFAPLKPELPRWD